MEAVVRWLNRDYLDGAVTGNEACPCVPTGNSTYLLLDQMYSFGGETAEVLLRLFGNLACVTTTGLLALVTRSGKSI